MENGDFHVEDEMGDFGGDLGDTSEFEEEEERVTKEFNIKETEENEEVVILDDMIMAGKEKQQAPDAIDGKDVVRNESSASNRRNRIHLDLEISIRAKPTTVVSEGLVTPEPETPNHSLEPHIEPRIHVDYPEGMVVTCNARVDKLNEFKANAEEVLDESIVRGWKDTEKGNENEKKVLNSTFVRPPFSSTLIYPIIEETEHNTSKTEDAILGSGKIEDETVKSTGSGHSIYKTVLTENEFGNISSIPDTDVIDREKPTDGHLNSAVLDFQKNPSLILNSKSQLSRSKNLTPAEELMQALHKLARYRGVWGVFEDEVEIEKHLKKLNGLLDYIDNDTIRFIVQNDYDVIQDLVCYFVLEERFNLRCNMLRIFSKFSKKSPEIGNFLYSSDIPITLARKILDGDFASDETYDFAACLAQMIGSSHQITDTRLEKFGVEFYTVLIEMIYGAQNHYYERNANKLFEVLLAYHEQMSGIKDVEWKFKWKSLLHCTATGSRPAMLRIKQRLMNFVMAKAAQAEQETISLPSSRKLRQAFIMLHDWIYYDATRGLFNDAELDILLLALTHSLEQQLPGIHYEAARLMHRVLRSIKTEPSGMEKMLGVIENLVLTAEAIGEGAPEVSYRTILRRIFKILTLE